MLENVVVALAVLLAFLFLARKLTKTYRQGGCSDCCGCRKSEACSCCAACLDGSEEDAKKD